MQVTFNIFIYLVYIICHRLLINNKEFVFYNLFRFIDVTSMDNLKNRFPNRSILETHRSFLLLYERYNNYYYPISLRH